MFESVVRLRDI